MGFFLAMSSGKMSKLRLLHLVQSACTLCSITIMLFLEIPKIHLRNPAFVKYTIENDLLTVRLFGFIHALITLPNSIWCQSIED